VLTVESGGEETESGSIISSLSEIQQLKIIDEELKKAESED